MTEADNKFGVIHKYFDELVELKKFVNTVRIGFGQAGELVSITNSMHRINKHLKKWKSDEDLADKLKDAEELENFAKKQAELKLPYLYNLALVRILSILEAFTDEVALSRLRNCNIGDFTQLHTLKISISEFLFTDGDERLEAILTKFKETQASALKKGNGRFQLVLNAVGVNGSIDAWAEKVLLEMCEIRNSYVHRSGIVDKRLIESCPWLQKNRGCTISVDEDQFIMYWLMAMWYVMKILLALSVAYNEQPSGGDWEEALEDYKLQIFRIRPLLPT